MQRAASGPSTADFLAGGGRGFLRSLAMLVVVAYPGSAFAQTVSTWANSNISGTGASSFNWFNPTQGTWGGGTPVQDNPATVIQFFSGTATGDALANTGTVTQTTVIDGTSAFQLSTLRLLGRGNATGNRPVTTTITGSALHFAAATGTIQFNSQNGGNASTVNTILAAPIQLGSAGTPNVLTIDAIGSNNGAANTLGGYRIAGVISEVGVGSSVVKTGATMVYLSGSNTFTGGVTINGGGLSVSGTPAGASSTSATVLGTGPLTINSGTLEISGNGGAVNQTVGSLSGSSGAVISVGNRTLTFGSLHTNTLYEGNFSGNGTYTKVGTGTTTLFSAGSTLGTSMSLNVSNGAIVLGAAKNFTLSQLDGTLDLNGYSVSSAWAGGGSNFTLLTGGGTFNQLTAASAIYLSSTASGTSTIRGTFVLPANSLFRSAAPTTGSKTLVIDGVLSGGSGSVSNSGSGFTATLQLTGSLSNTFTGTWAMSAGTTELAKTNGAIAIPTDVTLTNGTLRWQAADQIADTSNLTASNAAALNLNGYNETVATLTSPSANSWTNTSTSGTLYLSGTTTNVLTLAQGASNTGKTATINLGITGTVGGGISMDAGTATANQAMRIGTIANQVTLDLGPVSRTVTVTDNTNMAIDAQIYSTITGSGGLIKAGPGVLAIYGNNTLSGTTRVDAGTLDLSGNAIALKNSMVDLGGSGTLANYSTTPVFGGIANYSGFTLTGSTTRLTLNVLAGGTQTYATLPAGGASTIGFSKAGPGTLIFTGSSAWAGATSIDEGVYQVGAIEPAGTPSPLGSGSTVNLGLGATSGTLRWVGGTDTTVSRSFNLSGTAGGGGAIAADGAGGLTIASVTALAGSAKTLTFTGTSTALNTISAVIPDASGAAVAVVKDGPGLWRLTGTSDYSGGFTLKSGTVLVAADGASSGNSGAFGQGGAPLVGDPSATTGVAALLAEANTQFGGGVTVAAGSTQTVLVGGINQTGTVTFNTNTDIKIGRDVTLVAATGGVVKFGGNWWNLDKTAAPTADVTIGAPDFAGTVRLTQSGTLATNGSVAVRYGTATLASVNTVVAGTGTLAIDAGATLGGIGLVAGPLGGAGLVAPGNSPGILTAEAIDPTGGLDLAFEFTGTAPAYTSSSASVNDIMRLTGTSPFLGQTLSGVNVVSLYLPAGVGAGDTFVGGFFTDASSGSFASFLGTVASGSFVAYSLDPGGAVSYGGNTYSPVGLAVQVGTTSVPGTTNFQTGGAATDGQVTTFTIAVPEPGAIALAGIGVAAAVVWVCRRRCR